MFRPREVVTQACPDLMVDGLTLTSEMQDDSFTPELPAFLSAVKTCVFNF